MPISADFKKFIRKLKSAAIIRPSLVFQNIKLAYLYHANKRECLAHLSEEDTLLLDILARRDKDLVKTLSKYIPIPTKYEVLEIDNLEPVPTNRFGEDEKTVWLFGKHAKAYGLFLKDECNRDNWKLSFGSLYENPEKEEPFINQLSLNMNSINCTAINPYSEQSFCVVIPNPSKEEVNKILAVKKLWKVRED